MIVTTLKVNSLQKGIEKMEKLFKWTIFLSSYVPVFIMVFLNSLDSFSMKAIRKTWKLNPTFWSLLLGTSIISLIILYLWLCHLKKESESKSHKFETGILDSNDVEVLNFFVTFIVPIVSLKPSSWPSIAMNVLLLAVEGIFFTKNNTLYFNVLLIIFGFHVFSFDNQKNIVITRKQRGDFELEDTKATQMGTTNIFYM
ncbi:hypothetical protein [Lacticaseibacillus paracasei]|uniref:hypothetical protein n=2 Tax=Lacticaseibacillus paracasei TaxID=1597 RepID=UPI001F60C921|nr:hypothetical protein [Lacticaseibacillus paracasei]